MTNAELTDNAEDDHLVAKMGDRNIVCDDLLERLIVRRGWNAIDDCLDSFLIEEAFAKHDIQASDEEVSNEVIVFRHRNDLVSGDDTYKWLEKHHMQDDEFLRMCCFEVKLQKLKDLLFKDRLEEYFIYKRMELAAAELYKLVVSSEEAAREIVSSVAEGGSFFEYARQYSIDASTSKSCGYMGKVKISGLPAQVQELLSKSAKGDLLGPLKANKTFEVYLVESIQVPDFTPEVRQELEDQLFADWLTDAKAQASMELFV